MPSKNIYRIDVSDSFYHVYARGNSKLPIFYDRDDYIFFINLFARYLSRQQILAKWGQQYPHFYDKLELTAFCLMPNHFHLLIYQKEGGTLKYFMHCLMTSYSRYFNTKYHRTGSLFESRYKAVLVDQPSYLEHISRYIHMNPRRWRRYEFSSLCYYCDGEEAEWLRPQKILEIFRNDAHEYITFLQDYEERKIQLEEVKQMLADS